MVVESNILKQIQEKNDALVHSKNESTDRVTRKEFDHLKSDMLDKKEVISELIDSLKDVIATTSKKQQEQKVTAISNPPTDKGVDKQIALLRKQLSEKEALINVLQSKLSEKRSDPNKLLSANRLAALEKSVISTNEQNQKLLYELSKQKQNLTNIELDVAKKDKIILMQKEEFDTQRGILIKKFEEKKILMMQSHIKKIAVLTATINSLKNRLEIHKKIILEKSGKERLLMEEFNKKMSELLSEGVSQDIPDSSVDFLKTDTKLSEESDNQFLKKSDVKAESSNFNPAASQCNTISKIGEIMPMVELALDHGDSIEKIKKSLLSSGYSESDISEVFSKLKKKEEEFES